MSAVGLLDDDEVWVIFDIFDLWKMGRKERA